MSWHGVSPWEAHSITWVLPVRMSGLPTSLSSVAAVPQRRRICPQCQAENPSQENQPNGLMTWITVPHSSIPGYEDCRIIIVYFKFHGGIQGILKFTVTGHSFKLREGGVVDEGSCWSLFTSVFRLPAFQFPLLPRFSKIF